MTGWADVLPHCLCALYVTKMSDIFLFNRVEHFQAVELERNLLRDRLEGCLRSRSGELYHGVGVERHRLSRTDWPSSVRFELEL